MTYDLINVGQFVTLVVGDGLTSEIKITCDITYFGEKVFSLELMMVIFNICADVFYVQVLVIATYGLDFAV